MDAHAARVQHLDTRRFQRIAAESAAGGAEGAADAPSAVSTAERTKNPLRPATLDDVVGQEKARAMMRKVIDAALAREQPLDHVLLVGASGTGKSTFSHVIANELAVQVFTVEAPISMDTLVQLRQVMNDGDLLQIEEIHQQAYGERRGKSASTQPEVLYGVMEDRTLITGSEVLDFPAITIVGTTTDEGMLPDPFINRFPLRPVLDPYSVEDIAMMAIWNADKLGLQITLPAALTLARAARGVPRQINNYVKNAAALLEPGGVVGDTVVQEVLHDLNGVTEDGLTRDMQAMLTFLYERGKRTKGDGSVTYQSSVNTIATAIGKSRDSKSIALRVEPYLIEQGFVQVGHGGRSLTDQGIERARELIGEV
jgi:Holliday junction DNA helicase RuvB